MRRRAEEKEDKNEEKGGGIKRGGGQGGGGIRMEYIKNHFKMCVMSQSNLLKSANFILG